MLLSLICPKIQLKNVSHFSCPTNTRKRTMCVCCMWLLEKRSGIVNWFREFRPHSMQFSQCNRNLYSLRSLENMLNRRNSFWNVLHSLQELVCISHAAHGYWYFFSLFYTRSLSLSRPSLKINAHLSVKMAALFSWFYKNRRVQFSAIFEQQEKR